jgi:hypothetical protein
MNEEHSSDHAQDLPGNFAYAGFAALMGLVGLFVAAHAGHGAPYYGGLVFFVFAVLFIFLMIKHAFDKSEGLTAGGLPLFLRLAIAAGIGYLIDGLVEASVPDKAMLAGVVTAVVVFAVLAAVDRIAIRAE